MRLVSLDDRGCRSARRVGAKAARLARARQAGLPVLPGWALPVAEARAALRAGAAAVRDGNVAAARRAVLAHGLDDDLAGELRAVAARLGRRVIVRSSSPLEDDPRWSGAFSSIGEIGPGEVAVAVRSCWASAFAVDPLHRLDACGLALPALALGTLIQPEIEPAAGGTARVTAGGVVVEGVDGHPAAVLSGWADGATARIGRGRVEGDLAEFVGEATVRAVAGLAEAVRRVLGDDVIEWAAHDRGLSLLQSGRSAAVAERTQPSGAVPAGGRRVPATTVVPGDAVGHLVYLRPHESPPPGDGGFILLVDRPLPALAPLLFGARGVIARAGPTGSHLAGVARGIGVPMVVGCRVETVTGPPEHLGDGGNDWLAAIDGPAVVLRPSAEPRR